MEDTPRGMRLHIAIFGRRNAGKSSLINALTRQDIALVSEIPGTTTDPVYKAMEILPIGPVVIIDTAGIDDVGVLGELRIQRTMQVLNKTDLVLLVVDPGQGIGSYERDIIDRARQQRVPVVGVANKADIYPVGELTAGWGRELGTTFVAASARTGEGMEELKKEIIRSAPKDWTAPAIIGDLINPGDLVVLVAPIDLAAPKGRLILPQVQTLRDILDHDACGIVVKERELKEALRSLARKPRMVVTDSQAFLKVDADTPPDVLLTSFSILFARYKGDLPTLVAGAAAIDRLQPGDRVLISEACTHHRVADDIGAVKIPRWLRQRVGGELEFHWSSGTGFPPDLNSFKLVIHCGACMINRREMLFRLMEARQAGVPIVNYGIAIAHLHGILRRALSPFPAVLDLWESEGSHGLRRDVM
ncbi:ATP-binding protein [Clostridiales bacterium PH28_bin88]|nr:ATP-binding protein [Clostridiales bacterium PH28_bin88]